MEEWLEITRLIIGILGTIIYGTYMMGVAKHPYDDDQAYHHVKGLKVAKYFIATLVYTGFIVVITK